jgi:hypothetical protein
VTNYSRGGGGDAASPGVDFESIASDALAQERFREFRIALDMVLHQFLEAFGSCHRFPFNVCRAFLVYRLANR